MTEARYLPQHATTVDAEQRACLAVSAKGRPTLACGRERHQARRETPRPEPG
jgi:hypothetical protein